MTANPLTCKWCGALRVRQGRSGPVVCKHCDLPCGTAACDRCAHAAEILSDLAP